MAWLSHCQGTLREWLFKAIPLKDTLVFYNFIINIINNNHNNTNNSYIVTL